MDRIDFQTDPSRYRHWRLQVEGDTARLVDVHDEPRGVAVDLHAPMAVARRIGLKIDAVHKARPPQPDMNA